MNGLLNVLSRLNQTVVRTNRYQGLRLVVYHEVLSGGVKGSWVELQLLTTTRDVHHVLVLLLLQNLGDLLLHAWRNIRYKLRRREVWIKFATKRLLCSLELLNWSRQMLKITRTLRNLLDVLLEMLGWSQALWGLACDVKWV